MTIFKIKGIIVYIKSPKRMISPPKKDQRKITLHQDTSTHRHPDKTSPAVSRPSSSPPHAPSSSVLHSISVLSPSSFSPQPPTKATEGQPPVPPYRPSTSPLAAPGSPLAL